MSSRTVPVRRLSVALCSALACVGAARTASACGVAVGGVAGIGGCSLEAHEEEVRRKWEAGVSYSFTSTALSFSDDQRFDEQRHASLATLDYAPTKRATLRAGAGVLAGGTLSTPTTRLDLAPGFVGIVGGAFRLVDPVGPLPFVILTAQLSYASTAAGAAAYNAFDLRAGAIVGATIQRVFTPYVVGRGFGGPVLWRYAGADVTGTDVHHYQVGAGMSLVVARRVSLFAECVPLGEQGLAFGTSIAL